MARGEDTSDHPGRKMSREDYMQGVWKSIPDVSEQVSATGDYSPESPAGWYGLMRDSTGNYYEHGPHADELSAREANIAMNSNYDFGEITHMDAAHSEARPAGKFGARPAGKFGK